MNKKNSSIEKLKEYFKERWSSPDLPGSEPRFQVLLFAKDIGIFVFLPALTVFMFKTCENATSATTREKPKRTQRQNGGGDHTLRSQVIDFTGGPKAVSRFHGISKRAPGTLVKVKLLNHVETYANAPVHVMVIDNNLGANLRGATLLGDATPDATYSRMNINFHLLKHPTDVTRAVPIQARALSLSGTLGVTAKKKEGFFARAALGSTQSLLGQGQNANKEGGSLRDALLQAFASGLIQESESATTTAQNRANVLTLNSSSEFYAELVDYFPEGSQ